MNMAVASAPQAAAPPAARTTEAVRPAILAPQEFLTFRLGKQEYGIEVQKVQEIRGCSELDGIDDAPEFIAGAIELGGAMVPVLDLRVSLKLKLEPVSDQVFTVALILNLDGRLLGVMVDSVSDVIRLAQRHIRPAPASASGPDPRYLLGIGTDDGRKLVLLDIEELMLGEGMGMLEIEAY